jgi:ATP-binding cassette subfamily F protein uup
MIQEAQRSGALVAEVNDVSFAYGDRQIVRRFSTTIMRGDRIGIVGPNGAGKTTLLRLLLGQLTPQTGSVRLGTNQHIAYFDQLRQQLDEDATVQQNIGEGSESVTINGQARHVIGYLRDFLFSPERARTLVRFLSGGERNRVLLARLFAKAANIIVLDEPTNDLDAETLEILEDRLVAFEGTILLVSHDRTFLNNVVTSIIVAEEGGWREYVGGYDDWLRQRPDRPSPTSAQPCAAAARALQPQVPPTNAPSKRRLSFKEQRALAALPATIEQLETEIRMLHDTMAQPDFYKQPGQRIAEEQACLSRLQNELTSAYQSWEELEARAD